MSWGIYPPAPTLLRLKAAPGAGVRLLTPQRLWPVFSLTRPESRGCPQVTSRVVKELWVGRPFQEICPPI